jgi:osmoprotectant transport system permease protein
MSSFDQLWHELTTSSSWWGDRGFLALGLAHLRLSLAALLAAMALALPPAVILGHLRRGGLLAVSIVNIGRALPTFGIVALAFPLSLRWGYGLGFWPTFTALVLLGIPPMFTNAYIGIREVPSESVEAALGMGMRPMQVIRSVELPAALPLIVTGVRVTAVQVVATATLGAYVGYRCLGTLIVQGFADQNDGRLLAGAVLVGALSIATELTFGAMQRRLTPWLPRRARGRQRDATIAAPQTEPLHA